MVRMRLVGRGLDGWVGDRGSSSSSSVRGTGAGHRRLRRSSQQTTAGRGKSGQENWASAVRPARMGERGGERRGEESKEKKRMEEEEKRGGRGGKSAPRCAQGQGLGTAG